MPNKYFPAFHRIKRHTASKLTVETKTMKAQKARMQPEVAVVFLQHVLYWLAHALSNYTRIPFNPVQFWIDNTRLSRLIPSSDYSYLTILPEIAAYGTYAHVYLKYIRNTTIYIFVYIYICTYLRTFKYIFENFKLMCNFF